MGRFTKLRRNKKYNYSPRYYDDKGEGNPFKMERKLDRYRSTVEPPRGLKSKFSSAMSDLRKGADKNYNLRFLLILAVLILIVLYIIDFDLSIFIS
ncbi:riboflavin synthase subunit beta [Muriicola soli]|uniref:Riboflavin synthase subunit beta n=1 Tax=Muriicola soli TaxID=2507538 RepID=A0A411EAK7_9FLAO|nr:riboflavin synthase subunit beta [Muriicola soli]QBA64573.1 riboflavin synthase subunit beta [Muriicola soli]